MDTEILKKLDEIEEKYIEFWTDICNIESPTEHKDGVDKAGRYVINKAKEKNWLVEISKQEISGDAICITMNPQSEEKPVCFSAHMDTVHPIGLFGNPPVRIENGKLHGPGAVDCKGGIAASFMTMDALDKIGFTKRPIKLIIQSDEENSSRNSNKSTVEFMCEKAKDAVAFLNCEGYAKDYITLERKGIRKFKFEITGKAVHGAKCYEGVSAIREAAYKIIELEKMKDNSGITCNCGLIEGGTAENTVPEKCVFTADFRAKTAEQFDEVEAMVKKIAGTSFVEGTKCKVTLASWRYPMEKSEKNDSLFEKVQKIFAENNLKVPERAISFGGSDAADITHFGIPCIDNMGVTGENIHSANEFAYVSSLKESATRLALIVLNI